MEESEFDDDFEKYLNYEENKETSGLNDIEKRDWLVTFVIDMVLN